MEQKAHVVVYFYGKVVLSAVGVVALGDVRPVAEGQTVTEKTVCVAKVGNEEHHCIILYIDYVSSLDEVCRDVLFRGRKHYESLSKRWLVDLKDSLPDPTVQAADTAPPVPTGLRIPKLTETPATASPVTAPTTAPPTASSSTAEPQPMLEQPEAPVIIKTEDEPDRPPSVIFCGEVTSGYSIQNQSASNVEISSSVIGNPTNETVPNPAVAHVDVGNQDQGTVEEQADTSMLSTNTAGDLGFRPAELDDNLAQVRLVDVFVRGRSAKRGRSTSEVLSAKAKRPRTSSAVSPRPSTLQSFASTDYDDPEEEFPDLDNSSDDDYSIPEVFTVRQTPRRSHRSRPATPTHVPANAAAPPTDPATDTTVAATHASTLAAVSDVATAAPASEEPPSIPETVQMTKAALSTGRSSLQLITCSVPTNFQSSTGQWVEVKNMLDGMLSQNSWQLSVQHVVPQVFTTDELKTGVCSPKFAADVRHARTLLDQTKLAMISGLVGMYCQRKNLIKAPTVCQVNRVVMQIKFRLLHPSKKRSTSAVSSS